MACCLGSKDKEYLTDNDEDTVMGELDFTPPLLLLDITRWKFLSYSLQTVVLRFRIIRALQLFRNNYLKYNKTDAKRAKTNAKRARIQREIMILNKLHNKVD